MAVSTRETGLETFPLVPRARFVGISYGPLRSARRGSGSDVAGSRPYRAGDDVDLIDWPASARLSSALGRDEFVVRELHAEEAPRVVVVADRRPSLSLYPRPLPWLRKWEALEHAVDLVTRSTLAARSFPGYLDYADGDLHWRSPRGGRTAGRPRRGYAAPAGSLAAGLRHLAELRPALPVGSFLFVLSDFLEPPPQEAWFHALERGWDVVPVVIQDATWERSFPDVAGIAVPFAHAADPRPRLVRLSRREVAARRAANEQRFASLLRTFEELGVEPVVLERHEREAVTAAFLAWADARVAARGRGW
ncbi:MAG TPA: DUF58 domain-containing protein [Gaiellaceae bacterium]|nr:DUF58 domain-containing protein [Gaiellaceae bacterium]